MNLQVTTVLSLLTILCAACAVQPAQPSPAEPTPAIVAATPTVAHTATPPAETPQAPVPVMTPTAVVQAEATPAATPRPSPPAARVPLPPRVELALKHEYQKLNNCGPVALAVVASYFGVERDQFQVAGEVKGNERDKNVGPAEMQAYLEGIGLRVIVRVNGTREIVQRLAAARLPAIAHQWLLKPNGELVGHYRTVQGYDAQAGVFITSDSFTPPKKIYSFAEFDRYWQPWNRRYLVAYRPDQERLVSEILGNDFDERKNWQRSLATAAAAIVGGSADPYTYYAMGDSRLVLGDVAGAIEAYEKAMALGVASHFYWYNFGHLEAHFLAGNFQRVLDLAARVMAQTVEIEEVRYWRGRALVALGRRQQAAEEFAAAVRLNPKYEPARAMLADLR